MIHKNKRSQSQCVVSIVFQWTGMSMPPFWNFLFFSPISDGVTSLTTPLGDWQHWQPISSVIQKMLECQFDSALTGNQNRSVINICQYRLLDLYQQQWRLYKYRQSMSRLPFKQVNGNSKKKKKVETTLVLRRNLYWNWHWQFSCFQFCCRKWVEIIYFNNNT